MMKLPWWLGLVGFFGQSAIRMLRETWEGIIPVQRDPNTGNQIVRPQGADLLAQELFSVLNDQTPQVNNAPVTINQLEGSHALTVNSSGNTGDPPVLNVPGGNINLAGTGAITIGTPSSGTTTGANIVLTGANLYIPPIGQLSLPATSWNPLQPTPLPTLNFGTLGVPTPGQAYIGQVQSHVSGNTYNVALASATAIGSVQATALVLDGSYTIPTTGPFSFVTVVSVDNGTSIPTFEFQPFPFTSQQNVTNARQNLGSGGALAHLLTALANHELITDSTTDSPQTVTGSTSSSLNTGALGVLLTSLANLGIITNSTTNTPTNVTGGTRATMSGGITQTDTPPALKNLLTALAGLGLITDSTTDTT